MIRYNVLKVLVTVVAIHCAVEVSAQPDYPDMDVLGKADSIASLYPKHTLTDLKSLSQKLTEPLSTDTEKFRAIYRWVCSNIENDYGLYTKNKKQREKLRGNAEELHAWNESFGPRVFRKLLDEQKTVCTGYAYLIRELAKHADIPCEIINGYGRTAQANVGGEGIPNHSWNAVKLDDRWYLCDATWSSGLVDPQKQGFMQQYSDSYFLTTPSDFARNHHPLDTAWLLTAEKQTLNEFLNAPLIYREALDQNVLPSSPETFNVEAKRKEPVQFQFQSPGPVDRVELQIVKGSSVTNIQSQAYKRDNGMYVIDYAFPHKGTYVLHFRMKGAYIFTYEVKVSK
ncbi:hypothetical protein GCM10009122_37770 [Fulvivirga kasyanovii]